MKKFGIAALAAIPMAFGACQANAATLSVDIANASATTTLGDIGLGTAVSDYNPEPGPVPPELGLNASTTLYIFDNSDIGSGLKVLIDPTDVSASNVYGADLTYTFRGYEAGFDNRSFELTGGQSFANKDSSTIGTSVSTEENCGGSNTCLVDLLFKSTHNSMTYSAQNGGTMDTFLQGTAPNTTEHPLRIAFAVLGPSRVVAFFDDGGAGTDSDFDDMVLEINVSARNINEIPLPAPLMLLLSGLVGLGFLGRFRQQKNTG